MSLPSSRLWRNLARTHLILIAFFAVADGCKPPRETGSPGAYVLPNGKAWAFGTVQLANLDVPGTVMLRRKAPVQSVNTAPPASAASATPAATAATAPGQQVPPPAAPAYEFYGAIQATAGNGGGDRDLAYVDYHPQQDKVLAFAYTVDFQLRAGTTNAIDIFAILLAPGRSYPNRQTIWLGMANFAAGADYAAVSLADGLKLSLIADGVFTGQWALHFPVVNLVVAHPWQGMCPKGVGQMPGQNPSQNPGQFDSCRPLPAQNDLCNGDPTQDKCRPNPPVQQLPPVQQQPGQPLPPPAQGEPGKVTTGLTVVSATDGVYVMEADTQQAKIVFVSTSQAATGDDTDAVTCASHFYAVGRSADQQINSACVITPAPASVQNGRLTCAVTITFDQPQTYLERVCNVSAVFRGLPDEVQHLQVLKK